jgi:hypothetical protein
MRCGSFRASVPRSRGLQDKTQPPRTRFAGDFSFSHLGRVEGKFACLAWRTDCWPMNPLKSTVHGVSQTGSVGFAGACESNLCAGYQCRL